MKKDIAKNKINFIQQFKKFFTLIQTKNLSVSAQALWQFFTLTFNQTLWNEKLTIPSQAIMQAINMGRREFFRAREELITKGLIEYSGGLGNQAGLYKIINLIKPKTVCQIKQSKSPFFKPLLSVKIAYQNWHCVPKLQDKKEKEKKGTEKKQKEYIKQNIKRVNEPRDIYNIAHECEKARATLSPDADLLRELRAIVPELHNDCTLPQYLIKNLPLRGLLLEAIKASSFLQAQLRQSLQSVLKLLPRIQRAPNRYDDYEKQSNRNISKLDSGHFALERKYTAEQINDLFDNLETVSLK